MSAPYFIGNSSPAIAYSPRCAPGYSALSALETTDRVKKKHQTFLRNETPITNWLAMIRPAGTVYGQGSKMSVQ